MFIGSCWFYVFLWWNWWQNSSRDSFVNKEWTWPWCRFSSNRHQRISSTNILTCDPWIFDQSGHNNLLLLEDVFNTPPQPSKKKTKKLKQTQKIPSLKLTLPSQKEISSSNQGFLGFDLSFPGEKRWIKLQAVMLFESRNLFVSIALPKKNKKTYPESGYQNDKSM